MVTNEFSCCGSTTASTNRTCRGRTRRCLHALGVVGLFEGRVDVLADDVDVADVVEPALRPRAGSRDSATSRPSVCCRCATGCRCRRRSTRAGCADALRVHGRDRLFGGAVERSEHGGEPSSWSWARSRVARRSRRLAARARARRRRPTAPLSARTRPSPMFGWVRMRSTGPHGAAASHELCTTRSRRR